MNQSLFLMQQLTNLPSPLMDSGSLRCDDTSQQSNRMFEENTILKEQLQILKQSLADHQEKAATTETTMMEAIL